MADLKFSDLAAAAPANSVVVSNGTTALPAGVYINVSNLTGDARTALSDEGVVETGIKFAQYASKAQTTANAVTGATQINSFPGLSYGTPAADANGVVSSTVTASMLGKMPLDGNAISANV